MTPHKQLFHHVPDQGQIGDCWRTCIACLLDKSPAEVPHFCEDCWDDSKTATANARRYLASVGLDFAEVAYSGKLDDVLRSVASCSPGVYYMLSGTSRTGVGHAVIACDDGIVWDPSLIDAGIVGPMDDGFYWVTFLVPKFATRAGSTAS